MGARSSQASVAGSYAYTVATGCQTLSPDCLYPPMTYNLPACHPDAHMVQADRHGSFGSPSVCGGIVFFEGWSNRKIHHIAEAGLFEPAHDVNFFAQCHGSHLSPLRRCRRCRAPDALTRFGLRRLRGYRQHDEAERSEERHEG